MGLLLDFVLRTLVLADCCKEDCVFVDLSEKGFNLLIKQCLFNDSFPFDCFKKQLISKGVDNNNIETIEMFCYEIPKESNAQKVLKTLEFRNANFHVYSTLYWIYLKNVNIDHGTQLIEINYRKGIMEENTFRFHENLNELLIKMFTLKKTDGKVFSNLQKLKKINWKCDECNVEIPFSFHELTKLENANIVFNKVPAKNSTFFVNFENMTTLKEVHLINTFNQNIKEDLFKGVSNLEFIEISDSQLNVLPDRLFKDQINLTNLTLRNNKHWHVKSELFEKLTNLKFLDISQNNINSIFWSYPLLPSLEFLDIRGMYYIFRVEAYLNSSNFQIIQYEFKYEYERHLNWRIISEAFVCTSDDICEFIHDRNKNECPTGCFCNLERKTLNFVINCRNVSAEYFPKLPTPNIGKVTLNLENKNLKTLPNNKLGDYARVEHLLASGNNLTSLSVEQIPTDIEYLDLSNNNLTGMVEEVVEILQKLKLEMKLSQNRWHCDCDLAPFVKMVKQFGNKIKDLNQLRCTNFGSKLLNELDVLELCPSMTFWITTTVFVIVILLAFVVIVYITFRQSINIWLYEHKWCMSCITEAEVDKDMKYDAFISYSSYDEDILLQFVDQLEKGPIRYRLCLHDRDWLAGDCITDRISRTVEISKRIIIILSRNFLNSTWGMMEFRLAIQETLKQKRKRLIVVLYNEPDNFDKMDSEMRAYLRLNTWIRWDDPNFWRKLRYAMPHQQPRVRGVKYEEQNNAIELPYVMQNNN